MRRGGKKKVAGAQFYPTHSRSSSAKRGEKPRKVDPGCRRQHKDTLQALRKRKRKNVQRHAKALKSQAELSVSVQTGILSGHI